MYVLGIDGGGTKTIGLVADVNGNVFMKAATGGSNPNTLSGKEFEIVMSGLLLKLQIQNDAIYEQIDVCFAGMAGVGESGRDAEVAQMLKKYLPEKTRVVVKNDAFNALYSGTLGEPGIVQIAGTGAIAFGVNQRHKMVRSGGWGYLFDDQGSGFYLGNEALRAVFKNYDHRGPSTSLTERFLHHFDAEKVPDIVGEVYGKEHPRNAIAKLSPIVVQTAGDGDEVAKSIIYDACSEMMQCIHSCHRQLFEDGHKTSIILAGGVFTQIEMFMEIFNDLAKDFLPNAVFKRTLMPPIGGAIIAGLRELKLNPGEGFIRQLNDSYAK